uniref:Reverse transcriptase domain-containing protein n=1 Tax=Tanacetum cinerariifolium TaxID=118510 RepID=A0A699J4R6_TANCI|nr:reverse transcriptase domain-containing protein [Tanacetum cinerariifolium]
MSTRSSARNLFPPLDNPKLTIRRRPRVDPTLLNDFEMATNGNNDDVPPPGGGDLPVLDLRTMEELCQPTLNGRGGTFMKRRSEECYDLIENMTAHHNNWDTSVQRSESSSSITSSSDPKIIELKAEMTEINKNLMKVFQINQQVKAVTHSYETCGGPHSYNDCPASVGQTQNVYAAGAYNQGGNFYQPQAYQAPTYQAPGYQAPVQQALIPQPQVVTTTEFTNYMKANDAIRKNMQMNMTSLTNSNLELKNMFGQFMKMNTASSSGLGTLPSNTITNPKEDLKGITTRSGIAYKGPTISKTSSSPKVVECKTKVTKDTVPPTNNGSTKDIQPPIVQVENQIPNSEPVVAPVVKLVEALVSALKPNPKPFTDALILMPKFGPIIKSLLTNKEKLFELARTPLNEHCSAVLLKNLPEKMGDLGKFLIPCDFSGMDECLTMADLGASINLMPLSVWNKFFLPELSPTCMTLELADRLISRPVGVAEDVFVKVVTFHFPADFVVIDFDADLRVPLILGGSFLKTGRALIDVYEGELTLLELKDLPPHLAYAFLEGDDKLPVIIAKDLKDEEKTTLIKVLKSHKQALAWRLFDIKDINPEFYTHKILMEDDFKPAVQHQRRVNPKIHEVIKKEVLQLLDSELIYPISDSPWVSLVHRVPKKGDFTVVENEENELIPTRLVTGWRVCID